MKKNSLQANVCYNNRNVHTMLTALWKCSYPGYNVDGTNVDSLIKEETAVAAMVLHIPPTDITSEHDHYTINSNKNR